MSPEQLYDVFHDVIEHWTLINVCDLYIFLSIFVFGLVLAERYLEEYKEFLTLRVSLELWQMLITLAIDLLLFIDVLLGIIFLNPDIFADIKVGLPFLPLAEVLLVPALILRIFYQGRKKPKVKKAVFVLLLIASFSNLLGYSLVMEAAGHEWLETHPESFWRTLRNMRSNLNVKLSMICFYIFYPILLLEFVWGVIAGIRYKPKKREE